MGNIVTRTENINRLYADIRKYDILSKDEENALFEEYKNGNEKAKDAICNPNLRWIANRAKCYTSNPDKMQDLIQEGSLGMLEAFNRYEPSKGYKFFTYATYYIDLYMRNEIFNTPVRQANEKKIAPLVRKVVKEFFNLNERYPIEYEIKDILENVYGVEVKDMRDILTMGFTYIDGFVSEDDDAQSVGECGEFASRTASINEYEIEVEKVGMVEELKKYLRVLTTKENNIITKAYGLNGCEAMADEDIADEIGLTKERVRQIRTGAEKKMRAYAKTA